MKRLNINFPIHCKTGEVANSYKEYLSTDHWADVRKRYKSSKLNKKCCDVCKRKGILMDLHHKTYKRVGNERLHDFIHLCRECHDKTHKLYKQSKGSRSNLWKAHKKI